MSVKIALAGNPNCGKTTLFNALTGSNQFVGNWPGVTVEKKEGKLKGHKDVVIMDLPGIYSLSPYTLEEVVARNYLIGERPDAIINIVDGTNIERNLYLSTQIMELGIPVIMAINMMDLLEKSGEKIDIAKLGKDLGCEVVEISALKGTGIKKAAEKAVALARSKQSAQVVHSFDKKVEDAISVVKEMLGSQVPEEQKRFFAIKLLERDDKIVEQLSTVPDVSNEINALEDAFDDDTESIITNERYVYISSVVADSCKKNGAKKLTTSDKIDRIVTNRWLALPIFAVVMFVVYYVSVSTVGDWATTWANDGVFGDGWHLFGIKSLFIPSVPSIIEGALNAVGCADWLSGLILDGIVAGVGAVLGFVPQMLVLFIFLAFLESCGYMARVAFIMDRIFRKFGLSGKSFIPMLIGTGCGVPGVMASRTIENDRSGIILKKTKMFAGEPAPFVMELPAYHMPTVSNVLRSMWERAWSFIKKAGTIILLSTIILWFLMNFGWVDGNFGMLEAEQLNDSILATIGNVIAPIFAPLGWGDWKMAVAAVTGLIAKENVVGTFGILFGFAEVAAYSFLVFNLLCAPCFSAMGAIKREMNNTKWFLFAIGYQCLLAYVVSLCIFQIGTLITAGTFGIGTVIAFALIIGFLYLLFRPYKESNTLNVNVKNVVKAR